MNMLISACVWVLMQLAGLTMTECLSSFRISIEPQNILYLQKYESTN